MAARVSTTVDTTTKLSYLLPTGTCLTFQVLAPLATNNGNCGPTEIILTALTLAILVTGCVVTCFTDSYTAPDGRVCNGFLTWNGLWVPGFDRKDIIPTAEQDQQDHTPEGDRTEETSSSAAAIQKKKREKNKTAYVKGFELHWTDYFNAALSAIAFLALTMFTDPVSTCFYPNLSETILKTLPVLLATILSFCCSFSPKIRHGFGNSIPRIHSPAPVAVMNGSSWRINVDPRDISMMGPETDRGNRC